MSTKTYSKNLLILGRLLSSGKTLASIGRDLGVTRQAVSACFKGDLKSARILAALEAAIEEANNAG